MCTDILQRSIVDMKKKIIIAIVFIFIIIFGLLINFILLKPVVTLKGDKVIELELNANYNDPGITTNASKKEKKLVIQGKVDTKKVGDYKITYVLKKSYQTVKVTRTVKVVDKDKPIVTLTDSDKVILCPNEQYVEKGYQANDNYDGDITAKVSVAEKDNAVIYSIKDSSGNETIISRNIIREDKTAPTITLKGYQTVSMIVGNRYIENGASASDICSQDLSKEIKVTGSVNPNVVGTYYIYYEVCDSSGNVTKATRTIRVNNPPAPKNSTIYLTFDDGPSSVTAQILNVLAEENVKATFFVINRSDSYNYLIKRAADEGHTVGLHCYTHNYGQVYNSIDSYFSDLNSISNKVKTITGIESKIIRFPGGSSNTASNFNPGIMTALTSEVTARGYKYYDWNVGSIDTQNISSTQLYNNVVNALGNGNTYIVLMHDCEGNWRTANALRDIIRYGKNNGYKFSSITESTPQIKHRLNN